MSLSPYTYMGFKVVFVRDTIVFVSRTWKERLFSRPWRPWISEKPVMHEHAVRPGKAFLLNDRLLIHEADKANFLMRLEMESLTKERADKGEEAPLLVDPLSRPHNAGFEMYNGGPRTPSHPYQESAIPFGTITGRLPSKRDLIMEFQNILPRVKPKLPDDDSGTSQS